MMSNRKTINMKAGEQAVKQVIVIRRDLGMRRGKEISQGAHASTAWLTGRLVPAPRWWRRPRYRGEFVMSASLTPAEHLWLESSFRKVTLQVPDLGTLNAVAENAWTAGLECHVITDSGKTEFAGVPTMTALAIGPDFDDRIDAITGDLKLY
jgi:peptidyl-tRNA hydrolase